MNKRLVSYITKNRVIHMLKCGEANIYRDDVLDKRFRNMET
jgi:hypothetical protein